MWSYQQSTGQLANGGGTVVGNGYSGSPAGKNDPSKENVPCVGPIPRGLYTIEAPFNSPTHGPFAMPLEPDPANEMFGRSGFLMHGDSLEHPGCASEGCIIMPPQVRQQVWNSGDHQLQVVE